MIRGTFNLGLLLIVSVVAALAQENSSGQHDFDWEFGNWHTHLWRLKQPLSWSNEWVEHDGTTVVRKIWNGRANLVELEVDGPTHIEALNLRLYMSEDNFQRRKSREYSFSQRSREGIRAKPYILC